MLSEPWSIWESDLGWRMKSVAANGECRHAARRIPGRPNKTTLASEAQKKWLADKLTALRDRTGVNGTDKKPRIFTTSFASVYPLYLQKAEKKGRTKAEVDEVIAWLTGYSAKQLQRAIADEVDFEAFFARAPRLNPNVGLITGVVCGVRVENVADPLMQKIRYLDKLIDELAKGKKMSSILRQ
jgi:hypothetical protein